MLAEVAETAAAECAPAAAGGRRTTKDGRRLTAQTWRKLIVVVGSRLYGAELDDDDN